MTFSSGGLIDEASYNNLITTINTVFGLGTGDFGYGGNSLNVSVTESEDFGLVTESVTDTEDAGLVTGGVTETEELGGFIVDLPTVSSSNIILNHEWRNLRGVFVDTATHQGTVLPNTPPLPSLLDVGDIITFFANLDSTPNETAVITNRLNVDGSNLTLDTKLTSVRITSWLTMLRHEFTVDFGDEDSARHYFNTGGDLRISASRSGGTVSAQNTAWTDLLAANSPYIFTGVDYFALTIGYVVKQTATSGAPFASNSWVIRAKADTIPGIRGAKGSLLSFRSDFIDGSMGIPDLVDGTLTSTIQERRSTVIFNRPSPTFTTVTEVTAGS